MIHLDEQGGCEIDWSYCDKDEITGVLRVQKALLEEEKIIASFEECSNIWMNHSISVQASWLDVPDDSKSIISYIKSSDGFTSFEQYAEL